MTPEQQRRAHIYALVRAFMERNHPRSPFRIIHCALPSVTVEYLRSIKDGVQRIQAELEVQYREPQVQHPVRPLL